MGADSAAPLEQLVSRTRACAVQPARFFVAWQGVLTLAFAGFPPQLAQLKRALTTDIVPLAENPGSKWPKMTLGCLKEGARLTPAQLDALLRVCNKYSTHLTTAAKLHVTELHIVLFRCRSLERVFSRSALALASPPDTAPPDDAALADVAAVAAEADDVSAYWFHVAKDGQRESHYRGDASGATLVAPLTRECIDLWRLDDFRKAVDAELGPMYRWLADDSLHMTIRALL
jgi:hypothetical protein